MNEQYNSYYDRPNEGENAPKKKRGAIIAVLLSVAALSVIVMLSMGVVNSMKAGYGSLFEGDFNTPEAPSFNTPFNQDNEEEESVQIPLPAATERPMADIDGVAPEILDQSNPIPDIATGVEESVVGIGNYQTVNFGFEDEFFQVGSGSGFVISSEGYIVTNQHVVDGAEKVTVIFHDREEVDATLIGMDERLDIAVLKVDEREVRALKIGDSETTRVGEFVVAVGTPVSSELQGSVTMGIISALSREIFVDSEMQTFIQTDAAINFGNSGGPLLNMKGEVIGVNTAKAVSSGYGSGESIEGVGFALPINAVMDIVPDLITKGFVERPALGITIVTLEDAPDVAEEALTYGVESGVLVYGTVRGGPAYNAGILPGDIITSCNGQEVETQQELTEIVDYLRIGDTITVELYREGEKITLDIELTDVRILDYDDSIEIEE